MARWNDEIDFCGLQNNVLNLEFTFDWRLADLARFCTC